MTEKGKAKQSFYIWESRCVACLYQEDKEVFFLY